MIYLRLLVSLISTLLILTCLLFLSISAYPDEYRDVKSHSSQKTGIGAYLSLRNPAAFFISTATISLTDDNSTFFAARPAAFGPLLPCRGLSGQIWIGSGFGAAPQSVGFVFGYEGELGCSDASRSREDEWDSNFNAEDSHQNPGHRRAYPHKTLQNEANSRIPKARTRHSVGEVAVPAGGSPEKRLRPLKEQEDKKFLRESAEIKDKVVLLSRGGCGFSDKVMWAQRRGALAVIVGDNLPGGPLVRMYARGDTSNITIPSLFTSRTTAHLLSHLIPKVGKGDGKQGLPSPSGASDVGAAEALSSDPFGLPNNGKRNADGDVSDDFSREFDDDVMSRGPSGEDSPGGLPTIYSLRDLVKGGPRLRKADEDSEPIKHEGLWVTLTPTDMSTSPFFNTLFVLVVSPLITLAVVYSMLLLRSRIRRRRWRAPKSVVDKLPVRVYRALSTGSRTGSASDLSNQDELDQSTAMTPLLNDPHTSEMPPPSCPRDISRSSISESSRQYGSLDSSTTEQEKIHAGLSEWRRLYGDKQVECVVCLEEYVDGVSKVMSLPCGHEFHVDCITPWLTTRRRTCPICKGDVVRSMNRKKQPRHHRPDARMETEEDVQAQTAETTNNSPSAALPVPTSDSGSDVEQGDGRSASYQDEILPSSSWIARHFNRSLRFMNQERANSRGSRTSRSNPRQ